MMSNGGYAADGSFNGYSTANSSTWTDIANSTFALQISRSVFFLYLFFATAKITAGAQKGYVRGNIVGFDTTASLWFEAASYTNGMLWYGPFIKGPIPPGIYTVKMQAATDANTTTVSVNQIFHQILLLGA